MTKEADERKSAQNRPHTVLIQERRKMTITDVEDVDSFNEEIISLATGGGYIVIKGEDLRISKLNLDDGELIIEGNIIGMSYSDGGGSRGKGTGFLGKMFK